MKYEEWLELNFELAEEVVKTLKNIGIDISKEIDAMLALEYQAFQRSFDLC